MPAAVFERPRANLVKRVVECGLGRPDVGVHGRQARVSRHVVQPDFSGLYGGLGVAKVDERS